MFAKREEARHRALLEEITKQEHTDTLATNALNRRLAEERATREQELATSQRTERDAATALNNQKLTLGALSTVAPGSGLDPTLATRMRRDGLTHLIGPNRQSGTVTGPADDPRSYVTETFRGTPQQQALQQMLDDPNTSEPVKQYMRARSVAGDENLPYQMFQPVVAQTTPVVRVSRDRRGLETFVDGQWTPVTGEIPKGAHFVTEPAPSGTGEAAEMRRIGMFNRVADARERSPLVKAAERTVVIDGIADHILKNPTDPTAQMTLSYAFIQALDTYQSAVREGELANMASLNSRFNNLAREVNKILETTGTMSPEVATAVANASKQLVGLIKAGANTKEHEFARRAKASGVGDLWEQTYGVSADAEPPRSANTSTDSTRTPSAAPATATEFDFVPGKGLVPRK
ncbi:MAG TPA: hypothetical protein VFV95_15640 [Vicinamibacterales bacterium]|nr:hypothetical protein [Vicinamibacterales bacterium]